MAVTISQTADLAGVTVSGNVGIYSGASIGTAAADRIVVLCVSSALNNSGASAATIDGQPMWAGTQGNQGALFSRMFWLPWPVGTTAEFRVTYSSTNPSTVQNHAAVYKVVGAALPNDQNVVNDTDADPISTAGIVVAAGGGLLVLDAHAAEATARTWTGVTEDLDESSGASGFRFGTGFLNSAGGGTITTTVSGANNEDATLAYVRFASGKPPLLDFSEAFVGAGNLANTGPVLKLASNAIFSGAGGFVSGADIGAGAPPLEGTAAFAAAGSLVANALHFSAGIYDETGAATLSVSGDAFTELEFGLKLDFDNLVTGDVLSFRVYLDGSPLTAYNLTPSITIAAHAIAATVAFIGTGLLSVDSTVARGVLTGTAALTGIGNFAIAPVLRMLAQQTMSSAGLQTSIAVLLMRAQETLAGVGNLSASSTALRLPSNATFAGAGSLAATSKLSLSGLAAFSGVGSLLASNSRLVLKDTSELFVGSGVTSASAIMRLSPTAAFSGAGAMVAELAKVSQMIFGEAAFAGVGNLVSTAKFNLAALATFTASGNAVFGGASIRIPALAAFSGAGLISITPQEWMAARVSFAGAGLLVADLVKLAAYWSGEAAFIGAGNMLASSKFLLAGLASFAGTGSYSATAQIQIVSNAAYAGSGSLSATVTQQLMAAQANFSGVGSLTVNILQLGKVFETASFFGTGILVANTRQRMAVTALYAGEGLASIMPRLRMSMAKTTYTGAGAIDIEPSLIIRAGARATFSGVGNQSVLASMFVSRSAGFAGAGNMAFAARLIMNSADTAFAGIGSLAAITRQRMAVSGTFGGESDFNITPRLRMRAFANYSGAGSMFADLTPPIMAWTGQATFSGIGNLSTIGSFDLATSAQLSGIGNLNVDAIRFINLSEQFFAGTGSFIVGDIQQLLAGYINYGGVGYFSIHTIMTSARGEWLVCASIGFKPELDATLGIGPELPGAIAINASLEGKPNMKVC